MPGWHKAVQELVATEQLSVVGILQEQHPNRARLFHQWKGMNFPLLVDGLNRLGVKVVPIHVLIDGAGKVVKINPQPQELVGLLQTLTSGSASGKGHGASSASGSTANPKPDLAALAEIASRKKAPAAAILAHADAQFLWGSLEQAIQAYRRVLDNDSKNAAAWFRLGVALRHRFEDLDQAEDFGTAITAWQTALGLDPNQYIWRRRIQQYGPRLDKPYPFYNWVDEAIEVILARGETPVQLREQPNGAEIAQPARKFTTSSAAPTEPDAGGRITRDPGKFIKVQSTLVKDTKGRPTGRVHLQLSPQPSSLAHWNNEAQPPTLWIELEDGWAVDSQLQQISQPGDSATSAEIRHLEFEFQWPKTLSAGKHTLHGYLLYNVCEDVDGTCLYRRQDVTISLRIDG